MTTYTANPQHAFERAIKVGLLSDKAGEENFAGRYMYMFSDHDPLGGFPVDHFKHKVTRKYVHHLMTGYVTIA